MLILSERLLGFEQYYVNLADETCKLLLDNNQRLQFYTTFNGSRQYGYHNENSDFDFIGFYISKFRPAAFFDSGYLSHINKTNIIDVDNKQLVINYSLWDLEKFYYLLSNYSLQPLELLFAAQLKSTVTFDRKELAMIYFEKFPIGLFHNLINFAINSYSDFVNQVREKRQIYGMQKNEFYANFRLYQAQQLLSLYTDYYNVSFEHYEMLFNESIVKHMLISQFEFSYDSCNELKEQVDLVSKKLNAHRQTQRFYEIYKNHFKELIICNDLD